MRMWRDKKYFKNVLFNVTSIFCMIIDSNMPRRYFLYGIFWVLFKSQRACVCVLAFCMHVCVWARVSAYVFVLYSNYGVAHLIIEWNKLHQYDINICFPPQTNCKKYNLDKNISVMVKWNSVSFSLIWIFTLGTS